MSRPIQYYNPKLIWTAQVGPVLFKLKSNPIKQKLTRAPIISGSTNFKPGIKQQYISFGPPLLKPKPEVCLGPNQKLINRICPNLEQLQICLCLHIAEGGRSYHTSPSQSLCTIYPDMLLSKNCTGHENICRSFTGIRSTRRITPVLPEYVFFFYCFFRRSFIENWLKSAFCPSF